VAGYPIERPLIGPIALNPIDLAPILLILQLDVAALLGHAGAMLRRFFGSAPGAGLAIAALCVRMVAPVAVALRFFQRKDF
jgi:Cu-processing system permease protein